MQTVSVEDKQRTNTAVGRRIREARLEKGCKQKELAETPFTERSFFDAMYRWVMVLLSSHSPGETGSSNGGQLFL